MVGFGVEMPKKILIADDSPTEVRIFQRALAPLGHTLLVAADGDEAERVVRAEAPDLLVLDVVMPEVDGIELVKFLAQRRCDARILVISGYAERYLDNTKTLGEAFGLQSITAMAKPVELRKLEEFLKAAR